MNLTPESLARQVGDALREKHLTLTTAESCTGGWVAKVLTDITGSSAWFERGVVTYSNASKVELLGVAPETLAAHGAVSEACVREMAAGAVLHSRADLALAITGIAGPGGGSVDKPVGTVWFAWARRDGEVHSRMIRFAGEREAVRREAVVAALQGIVSMLSDGD